MSQQYQDSFVQACQNIQNDPTIGELTKGNLNKLDIRKFSIRNTTPEFRILYRLYDCDNHKNEKKLECGQGVIHDDLVQLRECEGLVDFIICGTREMFNNFYKMPLNKLKQYL